MAPALGRCEWASIRGPVYSAARAPPGIAAHRVAARTAAGASRGRARRAGTLDDSRAGGGGGGDPPLADRRGPRAAAPPADRPRERRVHEVVVGHAGVVGREARI